MEEKVNSNKKKEKFPEGTWLAIGITIGIVLGVSTDNIGIAIGFGIGIALGVVSEYFYGSLFKE
jgi:hypothetical protein